MPMTVIGSSAAGVADTAGWLVGSPGVLTENHWGDGHGEGAGTSTPECSDSCSEPLVSLLGWELQVPKLLAAYERALNKGTSRRTAIVEIAR
jgi:hypothetical protein